MRIFKTGDVHADHDFKGWYFGHHHEDRSIGKLHCLYNTIKEISVS